MRGCGSRHWWVFSLAVLVCLLVAAGTPAQVLHTLASPNEQTDGWFGIATAVLGDVDADGIPDVIVGAVRESAVAPPVAGRAYIFSGQTGGLLYTLVSPNAQPLGDFGAAVAGAGDVNGDGVPDAIVGAPGETPAGSASMAGRAYLFSGLTGDCLDSLISPNQEGLGYFGWSVTAAGDVDSDGYDDVAVGAYQEDPGTSPIDAGRTYVFSGHTADTLYALVSPNEESNGHFGFAVSGIGDVDNDGHPDLMVGAPREWQGVSSPTDGRAYVFSGATGDTIRVLESPSQEPGGFFGESASGAGDVDNDGVPDVIVGSSCECGGAEWSGRAYVFAGDGQALVHTLQSPSPEPFGYFGYSVSGAGDVNNDGHQDVIVGAPSENPGISPAEAGRAYVFCGQTGNLLWTLQSPGQEAQGHFGLSVSGAGDMNNAGFADVIVGALGEDPGMSPSGAGRAYVFAFSMSVLGTLSGGELVLSWTPWPGASSYWVYGESNQAHFEPGFAPGYQHRLAVLLPLCHTWSSGNGIGDPDANWSYLVLAVNNTEQELTRSNRVGEQDFQMTIDK